MVSDDFRADVSGRLPDPVVGVVAGTRVAGYLLEEQIGRGGMAVVFRAVDEQLDRRAAVKVLSAGLAADEARPPASARRHDPADQQRDSPPAQRPPRPA